MKKKMPIDIQDAILRMFHVRYDAVDTMRPRPVIIRGNKAHMRLSTPQSDSQYVMLVHFKVVEEAGYISKNNHTATVETITNWTYGFSSWDRFQKFFHQLPYQMPVCGGSTLKLRDSNGCDVTNRAFKLDITTDFVTCDL